MAIASAIALGDVSPVAVLVILAIVSMAGGAAQSILGLGLGICVAPCLLWALDSRIAVDLTIYLAMIASLIFVAEFRASVCWRALLVVGCGLRRRDCLAHARKRARRVGSLVGRRNRIIRRFDPGRIPIENCPDEEGISDRHWQRRHRRDHDLSDCDAGPAGDLGPALARPRRPANSGDVGCVLPAFLWIHRRDPL